MGWRLIRSYSVHPSLIPDWRSAHSRVSAKWEPRLGTVSAVITFFLSSLIFSEAVVKPLPSQDNPQPPCRLGENSFRMLPAMNKVVANAEDAIRDVLDGATIMIGGFGLCGMPENLIRALVNKGTRNLHTISNNVGIDGVGNGLLLAAGQIVHHIGTYVGENKLLEELVLAGKIKLELVPQGTFAERIRAGGAGIPAFYTPTGVGTIVAEGKETREFEGRLYVMERGLTADFALVKAWKGDRAGNLIYRKTARNFNPMMATAARITIAEVEHLVDVGELDGDAIHTPSIFVKRIFQGELYERRIERRTVRKPVASAE